MALLLAIAITLTGSGCEISTHRSDKKVVTTSTSSAESAIASHATAPDGVAVTGKITKKTTTTTSTFKRTLPDGTEITETKESTTVTEVPPGGGDPVVVRNETKTETSKRRLPPASQAPLLD